MPCKAKSLEEIIDKILDNPSLFYEKVAYELSQEEYNFIKSKIDKNCSNCTHKCENYQGTCCNWDNKELVGKIKVMRL